nr:retinol-binding protein pinta-like isoform X1 [Onthophagus taurus]
MASCFRIKRNMDIRPLSPELQAKAIAELNEDPKRIPEDIKYIKEWLLKQPHLKPRTDDQFILTFLRGCKFSLERTKEKLETYFTMRSLLPEYFKNRDPFDPKMQELLKAGTYLPLKSSGPDTPKGFLMSFKNWDMSTTSMSDLMKLTYMIMDIVINEDDQAVIAGIIALQDGTGIEMKHMMAMTPSLVKKSAMLFQDAYPNRPKAMHYFNPPSFIETIFNLFKPFMKEKLMKRWHIHNTKNINDMYEFFPKSILPEEYGGDAGKIQEIIDYWKNKVESYADWYKDDEKYGCDESKRPGKPKTSAELFGIEGSFRKLNVD